MEPTKQTPVIPPVEEEDVSFITEEEITRIRSRVKKTPTVISMTQEFVVQLQRARNEAAVPTPGGKLPVRAVYNAFGQLLYLIGTQTEYAFIRLVRAARGAFALSLRAAAALVRFVCGPLWALFTSIWNDVTAPIRYFAGGVNNMREAAEAGAPKDGRGGRARGRISRRTYRKMLFGALSYLLPVGALIVFGFTVREMLGANFSLGVSYNDNVFFIENEGVWDSAEKMVQERVMASMGSSIDWNSHPAFELRIVDPAARTGASELADRIISASSDQIMQAVGVRVNGELVSIVEDGRAVQQLLDDTIAGYTDGTHERVEYVHSIDQVPGIYFTNSVQDTTMALQSLVYGGVLSVRVIDLIEYDEPLAYTTEEQESDQYYEGTRRVTQRGQDGVQHVVAEQTSVDGDVVSVVPIQWMVTVEMQPEIITVGTKQVPYSYATAEGGTVVGSGSMIFPVPELSYITTRFGGHRGIDLCAPAGSPILAADSGVVVEAGWHGSFGNYILIDHGNGYTTRYAHCTDLLVGVGTPVARGQMIATVGSTGYSTGNHCHFEVAVNGALTDPAPYIGA
ncbi:MAG: peptidoglycan DD-metalloendopeptidase family protein [Subdoligranulum sp.]|nr:peptidoglycan DD-metalloendopeptidase family protein [Subdoligranulum sp.]